MLDLSAEIQRVEKDISRISAEREAMSRSLTENTAKTNETIAKLAAQIASLQTSKQRLSDLQGFDAKMAELTALKATHALCETTINLRTVERNNALSDASAKASQITTLNGQVSSLNTTVTNHVTTIAQRDATIADLLAQLQPLTFKIYNEYRSAPSLPNMPQIRLVNESEMIAPGDTDSDPPDPVFIDDLYDEIIAAGHTWIVTDNEAWAAPTNGVITTANMANFVVLAERAALKGLKYSQYQYPYRTTGFLTGSGLITTPGTENYNRLQTFYSNVIGTQELTDLMTGGLTPNFYYMPAVQTNVTKLRQWIDIYVELWQTIAPNKKMIPLVWPRWQNDGNVWIDGPMYRITLDKIKERCSSMILFGRSGNADPDPRTLNPVPAWYVEHTDFITDHGLTA